jgi:hypothetical protein
MLYLNSDEIDDLQDYFRGPEIPENVRKAASALQRLKDWTNENSDGWAYWKAPLKAAEPLMLRLMEAESAWRRMKPVEDITEPRMDLFFKPIRDLLSNLGHDAESILFPGVPDDPDVPDGLEGQAAVNWRKGSRAAIALQAYWAEHGPSDSYGDEGSDEFEDAIKNLLTDLRHLSHRAGSDFEALSSEASGKYFLELEMEDPDYDKS